MPETMLEAKLQPPKRMQLRTGPLHKNRAINLMNTNKRWQSTYKWALAKLGAVAENTGTERLLTSIINFNAQTDAAWKQRLGNRTPEIFAQELARDPESAAATLEDFGNRTNGPMFHDLARQIREDPSNMATPTGNFHIISNVLDGLGNALAANINKGTILKKVPRIGWLLSQAVNNAPLLGQIASGSGDALTLWAFNMLGLPATGSAVSKAIGAAQTPWRPGVDQFQALAGARVQLESERQKLKQLQESGANPQVIERQTKIVNDRTQELNRASQAVGTYRAQINPAVNMTEETKNLAGDVISRLVGQQSLELMRGLAKVGIPIAMIPTVMNSLAEFSAQNNGAPYTYDQVLEIAAKTSATGLASWASLHPEKFRAFMRNVTPTAASGVLNKFGPTIKSSEVLSALRSKVSELGTVGRALSKLPGGAAAVSKVAPLGGLATRALVPYTIAENTLTGLTAGIRGFTDPRYQAYLEGLRQQYNGSTPLDVAMNIPRALITPGGRDALMGSVGAVVSNDAPPVNIEEEDAARRQQVWEMENELEENDKKQYTPAQLADPIFAGQLSRRRAQIAGKMFQPATEAEITAHQAEFDKTLANLAVAFPTYNKDELYQVASDATYRKRQAQLDWESGGMRSEPVSDLEKQYMDEQAMPGLSNRQRQRAQALIRLAGPEAVKRMAYTSDGQIRPDFVKALSSIAPLEMGYQDPYFTHYLTGQPLQNDAAAVKKRMKAERAAEQNLRYTDPSGLEFNEQHQKMMLELKQKHERDTAEYEQQRQQAQAAHVARQDRIRAEANKRQPSHSQVLAGDIPSVPAPGQLSGYEQAMARYKNKGYMLPRTPYTISGFDSPVAKNVKPNNNSLIFKR